MLHVIGSAFVCEAKNAAPIVMAAINNVFFMFFTFMLSNTSSPLPCSSLSTVWTAPQALS